MDIGDTLLGTAGMQAASHAGPQDTDNLDTVAVPWHSWEEVHLLSLEGLVPEQKLEGGYYEVH